MKTVPSAPTTILGFLLVIIFAGLLITYGLSRSTRVTLPYTVFMFLFGILVSTINAFAKNKDNFLHVSIQHWERIHPDVITYAFLPPLLFGEAFSLNVHEVRKIFVPSFIVAIPGAAFAAYFQGQVIYWLLPSSNWSWALSFIVGTILCAVDPITVVATLKTVVGNVAATQKLIYFITGEALMSDAAAIIIYFALVNGIDSPKEISAYILKVVLISPLIGLGFGLCTVLLLKYVNRRMRADDNVLQVILTVLCAYSAFFAARFALSVSGVVSCCTAGVVISWLATPLILNPASVSVVWQIMKWSSNTVIFTVAGMIVANRTFTVISGRDIAAVFIVYIAIFAIRFVMLLIYYPFIKKFCWSEFSLSELVFSCFAGLRGAVSLTLTLGLLKRIIHSPNKQYVFQNVTGVKFEENDIHRAVFIICGVVFLNIVVNGSLATRLIHRLRLSSLELTPDEQMVLHYIKKRLRRKSHLMLERLQRILPSHDPAFVMRICTLMHAKTVDFITTEQEVNDRAQIRIDARMREADISRTSESSREPLIRAMACASSDERVQRLRAEDSSDDDDSENENDDHDDDVKGYDAISRDKPRKPAGERNHFELDAEDDRDDGDDTDNEDRLDQEAAKQAAGGYLFVNRKYSFSVPRDSPLKVAGGGAGAVASSSGGGVGSSYVVADANVSTVSRRRKSSQDRRGSFTAPLAADDGMTPVRSAGLAATSDYWTPAGHRSSGLCAAEEYDSDSDHRSHSHSHGHSSHGTTERMRRLFDDSDTRSHIGGVGIGMVGHRTEIGHSPASQMLPVFGGRRRVAGDAVDDLLIAKFRRIFLEVARRSYLRQIREGRIPRGSLAALTLLESVDVGHDTCHTPGLQDWDFINKHLQEPFYVAMVKKACEYSRDRFGGRFSQLLGCESILRWIEDHAVAYRVIIITSFLEAHRFAQQQIPYYLGEEEWAESPEEFLILEESNNNVAMAKRAFDEIPSDMLKLHVSRQAARMVLCMQEDVLIHYIKEGILLADNATNFLTEIRAGTTMLHGIHSMET